MNPFIYMILNNKKFVPVPKKIRSFDALFKYLVLEGAGRSVDEHGFVSGPWTTDLLATAISEVEKNTAGVEIRTVQRWFSDDSGGISNNNIRWLAHVFGCEDPEATSKWQSALTEANIKSKTERRRKNMAATAIDESSVPTQQFVEDGGARPKHVARRSLALLIATSFGAGKAINFAVVLWTYGVMLLFISYSMNLHSVTYNPVTGLEKQVGFFWAINWHLDKMLLLPIMLIVVSDLITYWQQNGRDKFIRQSENQGLLSTWSGQVEKFSTSFWVISLASFGVVFLLQWYAAHLKPIMTANFDGRVVDWLSISSVRADLMTVQESVVVSGLAHLYSGISYWCFFVSLLLIYTVVDDFEGLCRTLRKKINSLQQAEVVTAASAVLDRLSACIFVGIMAATIIKLNGVYLMTDAPNIARWLITDACAALGFSDTGWGWLETTKSLVASTFVILVSTFTYCVGVARLYVATNKLRVPTEVEKARPQRRAELVQIRFKRQCLKSTAIFVLLFGNFWCIGTFQGFSILLVASSALAVYSIAKRMIDNTDQHSFSPLIQ